MHELTINLHMHTYYSDGHASHGEIAQAAIQSGLDAVIVTDHNVLVEGPEDYYHQGDRKVLLLVGEEVHDQARDPQKNHLLVFGAQREMATYAHDPQLLLNMIRKTGGLAFLAHPFDPEAPAVNEPDISWVDWQVQGYTGIELWNAFSEFKSLLKTRLHAVIYAFAPERIAQGPATESLLKWDVLLANGKRVVAIGGSDAHAIPARLGPLRRTLFPYQFHFSGVNTHVFTPSPLSGDAAHDRRMIYDALNNGRAFVGYDLPAPTRGFRFTASGKETAAWMGEEISVGDGITMQIRLPRPSECRLLKYGKLVKSWDKRETCLHITTEPGVYRVEVYIHYRGKKRGWIFSNPIYVRE
jgi:hypothetical protein